MRTMFLEISRLEFKVFFILLSGLLDWFDGCPFVSVILLYILLFLSPGEGICLWEFHKACYMAVFSEMKLIIFATTSSKHINAIISINQTSLLS